MLYGIESNIWVGHVRTLNVLHWLLRGTASRWWGYKSFIAENYTIASVITTNKNQFNNRNEHGRNIKHTHLFLLRFSSTVLEGIQWFPNKLRLELHFFLDQPTAQLHSAWPKVRREMPALQLHSLAVLQHIDDRSHQGPGTEKKENNRTDRITMSSTRCTAFPFYLPLLIQQLIMCACE